jgi:hypothetical protein
LEALAFVRDLAIVLLALESLIIGILLVILTLQVMSLVRLLRDQVKPILESVDVTTRTVRGTTKFMSETFVTPMVRVSGIASGVLQVLRILTRRSRS